MPEDVQKLIDDLTPTDDGLISFDETASQFPSEFQSDGYDIYAVTLLWGNLLNIMPPVTADTLDWSGRLAVNGQGAVNVRCLIDFEPGQDSLLQPNDPSIVTPYAVWISYTASDLDGLCFFVFVRRDVTTDVAPTLDLKTASFSMRWGFDQLDKFAAYYPVANNAGMAILARRIWTNACPGGYLEGKWIKEDNAGNNGRMEGLWLDHAGDPIGILTGNFWTTDNGGRVFRGWVSGLVTDQIIAEFKGTWVYTDPALCLTCGSNQGMFRGEFVYLDREGSGKFKGVFGIDQVSVDMLSLPFVGTWRMNCPYDDKTDNPSGG